MQLLYNPLIPFLSIYPKRNENICPYKDLYTNVHSSFVHSSPQMETTLCLSTGKRINKLCYIHKMEYYVTIKNPQTPITDDVTSWRNVRSIMLSEEVEEGKRLTARGHEKTFFFKKLKSSFFLFVMAYTCLSKFIKLYN